MNRKVFFDAIRKDPFRGRLNKSQVEGINGILDAFVTHGDGRKQTLAYALATARHEVGSRMVPVREGFAKTDAGARRAVNKLARKRGPRSAVARYAKPAGPYGHVYYGRGHVQLTWYDNYVGSSKDAGVDLARYPDKMLDPVISARVLIRGLMDGRWNGSKGIHRRKGIAHYLGGASEDLKNARRTVNVTDKWQLIGGYYKAFLSAIEKAGGVPVKKDIEPKPPAVSIDDRWSQGGPIPPPTDIEPAQPRPQPAQRKPAQRSGFSFGRFVMGALKGAVFLGAVYVFLAWRRVLPDWANFIFN